MPDNFFQDPNQGGDGSQTQDAPEKIKLGDKEYSQEELDRLVGLGKRAEEIEKGWNRKIDDLYPEYTRKSQELAEFKKREEEAKATEAQRRAEEGKLTEEEKLGLAKKALRDLGFIDRESFEVETKRIYALQRDAENLLEDVDLALTEAQEKGWPKATREDLIKHMSETGIKNPDKAYKDMYEKEIDQWKQDQLKNIKPYGLNTQGASTAGSKKPEEVKVTRENMEDLLRQALYKETSV